MKWSEWDGFNSLNFRLDIITKNQVIIPQILSACVDMSLTAHVSVKNSTHFVVKYSNALLTFTHLAWCVSAIYSKTSKWARYKLLG